MTDNRERCREWDYLWTEWRPKYWLDDHHQVIASLRAELEELSKKHNCGEEPCAWVGGFCNHHAVEYYRCLEKDRDSLRERLKELVKVLQDWGHGMDCGCEDVDKPCPNCECGANEMFEARDRASSALQRGGSKP